MDILTGEFMPKPKLFKILLFVIFIFYTKNVYSAIPLVSLPEYPQNEQIQVLADSPELFTSHLLRYYQTCVVYSTQIKLLGVELKYEVREPNFEQISEPDVDILKKYYNQAVKLKEIIENSNKQMNKDFENLKKSLQDSYSKIDSLNLSLMKSNLENQNNEKYKNEIDNLLKANAKLRSDIFEMRIKFENDKVELAEKMNEVLINDQQKYNSILNFGFAGQKYFFNDDRIKNNINLALNFDLGLGTLIGIGNYLELYVKYSNPILKLNDFPEDSNSIAGDWYTNSFDLGMNFTYDNIFQLSKSTIGGKIGFGYLTANSKFPNANAKESNWKALLLNFEMNIQAKNKMFPYQFYISYSPIFFSDNLTFASPLNNIQLKTPNINKLEFGMKVSVWRNIYE